MTRARKPPATKYFIKRSGISRPVILARKKHDADGNGYALDCVIPRFRSWRAQSNHERLHTVWRGARILLQLEYAAVVNKPRPTVSSSCAVTRIGDSY